MKLIIGSKNFSSWSLRGWLAAKASGLAFEEICIPLRQPDTRERILVHSPSGKVPCLIEEGLVIWDSLAIAEYLAEVVPSLWPHDAGARAHARSVSAEMHSSFQALRGNMPMDVRGRFPGEGRTPEVLADIARIEAIWNDCRSHYGTGGERYLFGAYSIADMMYAPVCLRFETYGVKLSSQAGEYLQTMLAHPDLLEWKAAAMAEDPASAEYAPRKP